MAVKDYVGAPVTITQTMTFDMKEMYRSLKKMVAERGYEVFEPSYTEKPSKGGHKKISFFWNCEKKMEHYTKIAIEIVFSANVHDVEVEEDEKKHLHQEGEVSVIMSAYVAKDIEDDWAMRKKTGLMRLLREVYDQFAKKDKFDAYEEKLKKDVDAISYDMKTYFKVHRFD